MGMDNTFFKVSKKELKGKDYIHETIYESGKYKEYELSYFRKNYRLEEIIEKVFETDFIEYVIITKEKLKEIIDILNNDYKEIVNKEKETDNDTINRIYLGGTISTLEIIYKLFNFEEDYLIYECIY